MLSCAMSLSGMADALVLVVYYGALALLVLYGVNCYVLLYLRHRGAAKALASDEAVWRAAATSREPLPTVTVQLPVYNERYVVERLLDAVTALDYPKGRLEIQVLDDSTDETAELVDRLAERHRRRGFDVAVLRRADRSGFKAGALQAGLARARGEFIAVFDADFVPGPDFLRRTVPFFRDPGIGLVQARWGHINSDYSVITRAQTLAMDGHFWVEQPARSWSGLFFTFNGSAGVWRRAAIEDAGGWHSDTLTEDLDLSYRAQLRGWRLKFLPQVVCPAELPVQMSALKTQQQRWADGTIRVARKLLGRVLASDLPAFAKYQAALHLTVYLVYPLMLLVALLSPALPWFGGRLAGREQPVVVSLVFTVSAFGSLSLLLYAQRSLYPDWKRRILFVPSLVIFSTGLALNNTKAVVQALLNVKGSFVRTPKFRIESLADTWVGKRYRSPFGWFSLVEAALAVYFAYGIALLFERGGAHVDPFLAVYVLGFASVGLLSLWEALQAARERRRGAGGGPGGLREGEAVVGPSA